MSKVGIKPPKQCQFIYLQQVHITGTKKIVQSIGLNIIIISNLLSDMKISNLTFFWIDEVLPLVLHMV
jgi:hypothetical protein